MRRNEPGAQRDERQRDGRRRQHRGIPSFELEQQRLRQLADADRRGEADGAGVQQDAAYTVFAAPADEDEPIPPAPPIVAETRVDIPDASVSDAVMMLDLRNTTALMFRNSKSGEFNMVYRRDDGTIGWVEPSAK